MKKEEMTLLDLLLEALGIIGLLFYIGFQIYYGILYSVPIVTIIVNVLIMVLVYALLTGLCFFPEKVNGIKREMCKGKIKHYTIEMLRTIKLIFTLCLVFTSVCDVMGIEIQKGYSIIVVIAILVVAVYFLYF